MAAVQANPQPRRYSWLAHQPISRKILLAIGLLLGLFLLTSVVTLSALRKQDDSRHWADHTYSVLLELDQVQRAAQTSQIGLRGYMLGQRKEELDNFEAGKRTLQAALTHLRQQTLDSPLQQARLDRIQALFEQWQREVTALALDPVRRLQDADPILVAPDIKRIQLNYLSHRTARVEDITAVLDQMAAAERQLLQERSQRLQRNLDMTRAINAVLALAGLLLGLLVISLTTRLVSRPIRRMTDLMTRLAAHDHAIEVRGLERRDEIGEIARALQVFKQMAIETRERSWLKGQLTAFSQQLQQATSHREFAERLTASLMPLLQAGVGMFYGYDAASQRLDLLGSYGLRLGRHAAERYVPGEGLVGQCAQSRQPILLDQVPDDYLHIESGSGEALPRSITILPLLLRDQLLGVLELAGFRPLSPLQRQLLDELMPLVALTLENLNRAVNTQDLLEQTREQADELRLSSITLRQQQEALRQSNQTLQDKTLELEEQSQRLLASEEELRVQAEELQASNEELRLKTDTLHEQKQTLQELQRDTEEKAQELARASQYKSEFLANMSHELRTPLNSLLILSRSLAENREGNLDGDQVESARIIHDAGSSLLRLINDILDLSKIEAGKMELSLHDYPLEDLARSLRRNFDHVARDKRLEYRVTAAPGLPERIRTDPVRLEQIVNNLLGNAFKFTLHGSVEVTIGRPAGDLPLPERLLGRPLLAICVRDSGIGIPADKLERVFNAFEQVDASTSRQFGGTGLGLSISRRMAELLGGDIVLRSESGRGSEFTLLLPERPAVAENGAATTTAIPAPRPVVAPALLPGDQSDDRERIGAGDTAILIVEDDPAFARILADMVRQKGHRVLLAANGENGLALARRYRPLGILLDVMLPGIDGWAVIDRLKSDPATRHIPVHFLSANDDAGRGRELGAVGFLTKPVSREAIDEAFERLLHFAAGRTRRLLVVDDDAAARRAVRALLDQGDDVAIDEAGSAEQALQQIGRTGYDCIVLDLGLPGMSGLELLEQLADGGSIPPVVVYSGRELSREENLKIRQYTDSIVIKGARSPDRLLDEVSLFLHSIRPTAPRLQASPGAHDELQGHRLLLVDDDMRNLFALSKVLRDWGLQVSLAQDGHKALAMLAEDAALELVLMDIMMPGMDGYETIRAIRAQPAHAQLPIIALTAKAMRGDREKCLEAGASDYLSKPVDIDKLASMIRVWLRR
ncbi:histidine kinase [Frateuria sp. Soil773]|uniref:response regulator n=1 Tax=Frateuria sp. Soil773 TaxID=1736407 RepID=UPI0006F27A31|nr:response regulator [Frateuria sp. Soil773]KRE99976.1 histidine kinase [Frateuria sp. Soil773]